MQNLSLRQMINRLAGHPEELQGECISPERHCDGKLTDALVFLGSDAVILDLYKRYLDAKSNYQSMILDRDRADPLTEIASEHLDSAWCALESRIYELRQNRAAAARAALLQKIEHEAFEAREEQAARKRREQAENLYNQPANGRRRKDGSESALFLWCLALHYILALRRSAAAQCAPWNSMSPAFAGAAQAV